MTNLSDAKPRATVAVVGGVIAVLALTIGSFVLFGGSDDKGAAQPTDSGSSSTASDTPSTSTEQPSVSTSPVVSVPYEKQARRASQDGFPVVVPSDLPAGWGVTGVRYVDGDQPRWHLEITTPQGIVSVEQTEGALADLVEAHAPGAGEGEVVNLARWQIGKWPTWGTSDTFALGQERDTTSVLVVADAADRTAAISTAKRLLTMDTDRGGEGD